MATTSATATQQQDSGKDSGSSSALGDDFKWLVAWLVMLLVIALAQRSRVGQVITYYVLALSIVFLLVTQFRFFAGALAPFAQLGPGLSNGEGPQGG